MTDVYFTPSPSADGFVMDNVFWKPRVNYDWDSDGIVDDQSNPTVQSWLRQGMRDHFDALGRRAPGKIILGNIADWTEEAAVFPELDKYMEGGVIESLIGQSYSPERWASWAFMMIGYRKTLNATVGPKLTVLALTAAPRTTSSSGTAMPPACSTTGSFSIRSATRRPIHGSTSTTTNSAERSQDRRHRSGGRVVTDAISSAASCS